MGSSKLYKIIVMLYIVVFLRWTFKAIPLLHRVIGGKSRSVSIIAVENAVQNQVSRFERRIGQSARPNLPNTGLIRKNNNVLIVGYGKFFKHKYPIQCDCQGDMFVVNNDTKYMSDADLVVFTVGAQREMSLDDWRGYHSNRHPSQVWVLGSRESPQTCLAVLPPDDMKATYNWSFTYHSQADFPTPYGWYKTFDVPQFGSINWYARKKSLISWTSSHCPLPAGRYRRRDFVTSLQKYLNVSMYGTCGDGRFDGDDYVTAAKDHKFALVLENSCCSEYITEKFWDALTVFKQVPVVYGATREEYEKIAPPGSFVFVQDFHSLKGLADYIKKVGSDENEYNKFHYWRRMGYATKQNDEEDRVFHCHSVCRMAEKYKEVRAGKQFHFDEKSSVYFGGCRECQKEMDVLLSDG